ncbi:MAG: hypothetical protein RI953_3007 [Pseudomonadota bacterium]
MSSRNNFCMSVDFGTSNTLVFSRGEGVVVNQASLLAVRTAHQKNQTMSVYEAGSQVAALVGKTSSDISVESPLNAGVIQDTELAKILLQILTEKFLPWSRHLPFSHSGKGILISAPCEITEYERNAFYEAARSLGFARVGLIDEPLSAALGAGLELFKPSGQMLVDLGSGITEAVVIGSGGVVQSGSFRQGGNDVDAAIVQYLIDQHQFEIPRGLAKEIKERFCGAGSKFDPEPVQISGKCVHEKLPRKKMIHAAEFSECIQEYVSRVQTLILSVLEKSEPELVSDIMESGIWLSGGGALLQGLPEALTQRLQIPVRKVEDPLGAVIKGSGKVVADPELSSLCRAIN